MGCKGFQINYGGRSVPRKNAFGKYCHACASSACTERIDGVIIPGKPGTVPFDFTSDKFKANSYLYKDKKRIYVSSIETISPGHGHLKALFNNIHSSGYTIAVPTPLGVMPIILNKWKFKKTEKKTPLGALELWIYPAKGETE